MNFKQEKWILPKSFDACERGLRKKMENFLAETGRSIECPEIFDGSEIDQTNIFKQRFLSAKFET